VEGAIGVSRADAGRLGIRAGEKVRVASALGYIEREVRVDQDLAAGMVYVPTAVHGNDAKNLLGLASPDGPWFPGWKSCAVKIEKLER
jgi:anaerobic selenocysteine-containing dehydrogenase